MLFDPARHEPLQPIAWDADQARAAIARIVTDTEARFTPERYWPPHPRDLEGRDSPVAPYTPLYHGACGVVWALHYLQDVGAVQLTQNYRPHLDGIQARNRAWLQDSPPESKGAYLMGDTPFALLACADLPCRSDHCDTLAALIEDNMHNPARELMWGSPGTLLAALRMHGHTGEERWADLYRRAARTLWSQLLWSDQHACHYWTQDLYGQQFSFLDGVHGFVATALPLIQGRHLMAADEWAAWQACIVNTMARTASREGALLNWRDKLLQPADTATRFLMQFCHGAPGYIICLADLPCAELDAALLQAGEAVWTAGPLVKGSNLCHGTGGNGYAFLKLYERTADPVWLQRARAFAMHGMAQTQADALRFGQHRYSLWTGDPGFAIYLWDCLRGASAFPTLDCFFTPPTHEGLGTV